MLITAQSTNIRTSPRKLRLVADLVRPLSLDEALVTLKHIRKRAALPLGKTLRQAQANAVSNFNLPKDKLTIKTIEINVGPTYKRGRAVSKGRGHSIKKRTSHIKVVLEGNGPKSKS
ncbi:50S ribosomal protein L22 [Patescibacteria group bacterium]|nr:50S ribosomal protein L22 [Patescibacteria group bacterium]